MAKYLEVMKNGEQLKAPGNKKTEGTQNSPLQILQGLTSEEGFKFPCKNSNGG